MSGHHRQTVMARFLRPSGDVPFRRERITTPDGDFLDLDFPFPDDPQITDSLVLVLHGLEGSARSKYALETYRQLRSRGIPAVGLNFRSCSGEVNRRARLYHSGETTDLAFVLDLLRERFPDTRVSVAGFSLGGNALLKYLGENGVHALVWAATAVSVPFDLSAGSDNLERPGGRMYLSFLLRKLRRKTRLKAGMISSMIDVDAALASRTFREFDDAATAPLHGFADAEDYYRRSSSGQFIEHIKTPTHIFHSLDDPFLPEDRVPREAVNANRLVDATFTPKGGHVGFLAGTVFAPQFWAERQVASFLSAQFAR